MGLDCTDAQVISLFAATWSGLAASGNPNTAGLPGWTRVASTGATDTLLTIDTAPQTLEDYRAEKCAFWASFGLANGG